MATEIRSLEDVEAFTKQLITEGVNAHPDEDFHNYINLITGECTYSEEEAAWRNLLMEDCFTVCERHSVDIYDFMQAIFLRETGMDKFIPLPS